MRQAEAEGCTQRVRVRFACLVTFLFLFERCAFVLWQNVCPHEIIAKLTFNKWPSDSECVCSCMCVCVCVPMCKTFNELFASQLRGV